jgi:3-dehydroquinate dehydratase/shikimate dehydrogenase
MKLVCAPVKKWPQNRPVDLYEFREGSKKLLYDREERLQFVDMDWKEKPGSASLISYHNFDTTPDLEAILSEMKQRHPSARYYKIATFAQSTLDSLRMLHFQRQHPKVIGLCMGDKGTITRILSPFTYAPLTPEEKNAPGQLLWSELETIYHYSSITSQTRLYGLIGDPVHHSIGHLYHNDQFRQHGIDAVYLKMVVTPEELPLFFKAIETLPFNGLSVTAPLKEKLAVLPMNTLYRTQKGWEMCNTDGVAAADVLQPTPGQHVVILGVGGAAKAIASELKQRGAHVVLLRRGMQIPAYDILINATSSKNPDFEDRFIPGKVVMDIATSMTPFLLRAIDFGCHGLDGFPMFFGQAAAQFRLWSSYINRNSDRNFKTDLL